MAFIDVISLALLFIGQPVNSAYGYRHLMVEIAAGREIGRIGYYRQTLALQWVALLVIGLTWMMLSRPTDLLGFTWPTPLGWWLGGLVTVIGTAFLLLQVYQVRRRSSDEKSLEIEKAGSIIHFLPHTRKELHYSFGLSVTAGICEEIIYRGYVLWCLSNVMSVWVAAVVSSVGFGLGHAYQGWGGIVKTGLAGLVFAALYIGTGSLLYPIIAHILLDALQMQMVYDLQDNLQGDDEPGQAV